MFPRGPGLPRGILLLIFTIAGHPQTGGIAMPAESHDFNGGFQTRVVPFAAPQHCGQDGRVAEADSCQGVRVKTNFRLRGGDGEAVSMGAISNKILKLRDEELWIAVRNGHVMGIDAAVGLGADVNAPVDWLSSIPDLPAQIVSFPTVPPSNQTVHMSCVPTGMAQGWRPIHLAAWLGLPDAAEALLLDGADVSAASSCGTTPMHLAAHGLYMSGRSFSDGCADYQRVITLLRHAGADIDPRDAAGWTPLMIAARHNRPNLVLELLDLGADAKAEDSSGSGLMERATELKQQHRALREYTLTLLKSAGAIPLKVTDAVSSKERWQFGVSGAVWDRGVRLKLHLMGLFLGVSASIRNPRGHWLSVHFNLGKDQWKYQGAALKKGQHIVIRAEAQRIFLAPKSETGRSKELERDDWKVARVVRGHGQEKDKGKMVRQEGLDAKETDGVVEGCVLAPTQKAGKMTVDSLMTGGAHGVGKAQSEEVAGICLSPDRGVRDVAGREENGTGANVDCAAELAGRHLGDGSPAVAVAEPLLGASVAASSRTTAAFHSAVASAAELASAARSAFAGTARERLLEGPSRLHTPERTSEAQAAGASESLQEVRMPSTTSVKSPDLDVKDWIAAAEDAFERNTPHADNNENKESAIREWARQLDVPVETLKREVPRENRVFTTVEAANMDLHSSVNSKSDVGEDWYSGLEGTAARRTPLSLPPEYDSRAGNTGCARISRQGVWSCLWCMFPAFGSVVRPEDVWSSQAVQRCNSLLPWRSQGNESTLPVVEASPYRAQARA